MKTQYITLKITFDEKEYSNIDLWDWPVILDVIAEDVEIIDYGDRRPLSHKKF